MDFLKEYKEYCDNRTKYLNYQEYLEDRMKTLIDQNNFYRQRIESIKTMLMSIVEEFKDA